MTELPPFNNPPPRPQYGPLEESTVNPGPPSVPEPAIEPAAEPDRWAGSRSLLAWILRWAILGVGVGGAWLFGILVAQFFPAPNPQPPLQEVVARRTSRFFQKLGSLPDWWAGDTLSSGGAPVAIPNEPAASPDTQPPQPIVLTDAQREQVTFELEAIEAEMQALRDRTSAVERQLGLPNIEITLEDRIENAANRLSPPTEAPPADTTTSAPALQPAAGPSPDPLFQVNAYRVTLPSDVLFPPGESILQTNAQPLLDSILQDIARYPDATIVVGSYTDTTTEETTPTELSYQQAIAVQRYLAQRLGENSAHWVAVGYGNSALGSTGSVQLSRRITIAIVP
jgi:OOP family OmpA-OmpF porin